MIASVKPPRYFVRRGVAYEGKGWVVDGWDVCDFHRFDRIALYKFPTEEQAEGACKLLNSNEENKE